MIICNEEKWYKDHLFWLLILIVNMSGNICFRYIFPYELTLIFLFIAMFGYSCLKNTLTNDVAIFYMLWGILLFIQGTYLSEIYSISSTVHAFIKMVVGTLIVCMLKEKFIRYYNLIVYFFSVISLICFFYNCLGGILPYIPVSNTNIDGGNIFRVSSVIYTQLYNLQAGSLTLRNCGPFWEPGAFQGFVNLAIALEILTNKNPSKQWYIKLLILALTVITTLSTGGYIVLFINIMWLLIRTKKISSLNKYFLLFTVCFAAISFFISTDFLYQKISSDEGRLGVSLNDIGSGMYMFFGYGYSAESIMQSDIKTASSLFNLIRYVGLTGLLIFIYQLFSGKLTMQRLYFGLIIIFILTNEPFLTEGPFWWGILFIWKYIEQIQEQKLVISYE